MAMDFKQVGPLDEIADITRSLSYGEIDRPCRRIMESRRRCRNYGRNSSGNLSPMVKRMRT
jgi:hypothetical protein